VFSGYIARDLLEKLPFEANYPFLTLEQTYMLSRAQAVYMAPRLVGKPVYSMATGTRAIGVVTKSEVEEEKNWKVEFIIYIGGKHYDGTHAVELMDLGSLKRLALTHVSAENEPVSIEVAEEALREGCVITEGLYPPHTILCYTLPPPPVVLQMNISINTGPVDYVHFAPPPPPPPPTYAEKKKDTAVGDVRSTGSVELKGAIGPAGHPGEKRLDAIVPPAAASSARRELLVQTPRGFKGWWAPFPTSAPIPVCKSGEFATSTETAALEWPTSLSKEVLTLLALHSGGPPGGPALI
jgi:hypothetical protein